MDGSPPPAVSLGAAVSAVVSAAARVAATKPGSIPEPIPYTDESTFRAARQEWQRLIRCDKAIRPSERLVLDHLAGFTAWDAFAWPSAETLAVQLDVSERSVKRALAVGRQRGWISRVGRRGFNGSVAYRLSVDPTIADAVRRRLDGEKISRQIRRAHPEMKALPRPKPGRRKGHPCPVERATRVPWEGPPVSPYPIQGTGPSEPVKKEVSEKASTGQSAETTPTPSTSPPAAQRAGERTGRQQAQAPLAEDRRARRPKMPPPTDAELRASCDRLATVAAKRGWTGH